MRHHSYNKILVLIALILLWWLSAWFIARAYYLSREAHLVDEQSRLTELRSRDLADSIRRNLNYFAGVPGFFVHAVRVNHALSLFGPGNTPSVQPLEIRRKRWLSDPVLKDLDQTMAIAGVNFHVDQIYILNAAGDTIAASNWDTPTSLVGINFADRDYFRMNKSGKRGQQYAVGRSTHIAGIYFSAPVMVKGRFMGAVVAKADVPNMSFLINQTDGFVVDANGVIILSHDKDKTMRALAGAPVNKLPVPDRERIYRRSAFPELNIASWGDGDFKELLRIQGETVPQVMASTALPDHGLTVYAEGDLPTLPKLIHEKVIFFLMLSVVGSLVILSAFGALLYTRSIERASDQLRESRELLKLFIEFAPAALAMFDRDMRYLSVSQRWLGDYGLTGQEITGRSHYDMLPEIAERWKTLHQRALQGEVLRSDHDQMVRNDGSIIWLRWEIRPWYAAQHIVGGIVIFSEDITERVLAEQALKASEARLLKAQQVARMGFLEWNLRSEELVCSDEIYALYGVTRQAFPIPDKFVMERVHPEDRALVQNSLEGAIRHGTPYNIDHRIVRPDGDVVWVHAQAELIDHAADVPGYLLGTIIDITDRKRVEDKLQRMTRLYATLSQCNQAIVRCANEWELYPQICRDVVNFGGMKMAWIGVLDTRDNLVRPAASFGAGVEYLEGIDISAEADSPIGRGPVGTAIRENTPYWCQNFREDPNTAAWHERADRFGWGAMAALPLRRKGIVIGAFALYADVVDAFDEPAQALLVEMAMDISFALDHFTVETEREQANKALRISEQHLRTIIETEPECLKVVSKSGQLIEMNAAGLTMLEADSLEQIKEYSLLDFILPPYRDAFMALHQRVINGENGSLQFEILGLKGTRRWLETHAAPMRDENGAINALLGVTLDITERKHSEARINYLANYDALTGLPNRVQLDDHLKYALSLARRNNGRLAVMFVDIDRFKDINDTLGHSVGDAVLVEIANRLKLVLREEDVASRLGGDEFILMLPDSDARGAAQVAQKLLRVVSEPYRNEQYDLAVTASIGIALYPEDGTDLETLSRKADTAMYRAKHEGRDSYRFFTPEMQKRVIRNMHLLNALRNALERDQFSMHYQPQISIDDNRMIGVEALLRWHHPELGDVSPEEFIPVAEDSGLILSIGEWVLRAAVRQLKRWMNEGHPPMSIAVNLSAVQFRNPSLPDLISRILDEAELPAKYLELELTEGVAMTDPQGAIAVMNNLHERGIRMSIDDFGTGYSSLNYLKKFMVYKVKIDQSFVRDITTDLEDRAIVAAIISMSKNLGLQTIAEGVETSDQLDFLREQGCDEAQGYYFGKPLPTEQFESVFVRHEQLRRTAQ